MTRDGQRRSLSAQKTRDLAIRDLIWRGGGRRCVHRRAGMRMICPCLTMGSAGVRFWRIATHLYFLDRPLRPLRPPRAHRGRTTRRMRSSSRREPDGKTSTLTRGTRNYLTHLYHYNLSGCCLLIYDNIFMIIYIYVTLCWQEYNPFEGYYLVFQNIVVYIPSTRRCRPFDAFFIPGWPDHMASNHRYGF